MRCSIPINRVKRGPVKVVDPARGQLNKENEYFPIPVCVWEIIWSRETVSAAAVVVVLSLVSLLTSILSQAASGACYSSRFPRRPPFIYLNRHTSSIWSVPSLLSHAIACRWGSLRQPWIHRHGASKPQGSSKRVLPGQVTMDQLICASLFPHTSCFLPAIYRRRVRYGACCCFILFLNFGQLLQ